MQKPLELIFKNFEDRDGVVEQVVLEKVKKLEQVCPRLISCHVAIEQLQNSKHNHHSYSIHIVVNFPPHHEVVITRHPQKGDVQEQLLTTQVRDAFIAARRQVQEIMDKHQGRIKIHENNGEIEKTEEVEA
ncbi:MAG: hypothetical protein AB1650_03130 [Candidatus Omnitrophota bacterium]